MLRGPQARFAEPDEDPVYDGIEFEFQLEDVEVPFGFVDVTAEVVGEGPSYYVRSFLLKMAESPTYHGDYLAISSSDTTGITGVIATAAQKQVAECHEYIMDMLQEMVDEMEPAE